MGADFSLLEPLKESFELLNKFLSGRRTARRTREETRTSDLQHTVDTY